MPPPPRAKGLSASAILGVLCQDIHTISHAARRTGMARLRTPIRLCCLQEVPATGREERERGARSTARWHGYDAMYSRGCGDKEEEEEETDRALTNMIDAATGRRAVGRARANAGLPFGCV
ncbi:hypothetical protein GGTG_13991 [Gaeumannomyces tritici R3-111a-1]|uniref:Uncharacterized protein n=1 Tax=Gaeumannomyces tritici (strain R3-111a-1) TaxID=644352 RepID=J3PKD7_GAET3|nr:hypothetical protein GGTG_13991 [Gaeumannomyces tritici R3-111a-1]EJT68437.1 hypothetical protein GGTG_13991 [Gaeumannomyces tritici R3-111a-1]